MLSKAAGSCCSHHNDTTHHYDFTWHYDKTKLFAALKKKVSLKRLKKELFAASPINSKWFPIFYQKLLLNSFHKTTDSIFLNNLFWENKENSVAIKS